MQRLSVGVWHSGPVKVGGQRQRGPRWPETHVPPFLQFRLPQERASYSQEEPVKPYRNRDWLRLWHCALRSRIITEEASFSCTHRRTFTDETMRRVTGYSTCSSIPAGSSFTTVKHLVTTLTWTTEATCQHLHTGKLQCCYVLVATGWRSVPVYPVRHSQR